MPLTFINGTGKKNNVLICCNDNHGSDCDTDSDSHNDDDVDSDNDYGNGHDHGYDNSDDVGKVMVTITV